MEGPTTSRFERMKLHVSETSAGPGGPSSSPTALLAGLKRAHCDDAFSLRILRKLRITSLDKLRAFTQYDLMDAGFNKIQAVSLERLGKVGG
jgi:hypothetical protein